MCSSGRRLRNAYASSMEEGVYVSYHSTARVSSLDTELCEMHKFLFTTVTRSRDVMSHKESPSHKIDAGVWCRESLRDRGEFESHDSDGQGSIS